MPARRSALSPRIAALLAEGIACLRFYTRLPLPVWDIERSNAPEPFSRALRWAPLAGAVVGACGGAILLASAALGLPPLVGAVLAVAATILASGALHEDGLADVADGFGGGVTRERKLDIMRDSRVGTYGAIAVGLSMLLRAASLTALVERGGAGATAGMLVAAAAVSRGFGLMPMAWLAPARPDGLGRAVGRLPARVFPTAGALAVVVGVALPWLTGDRPGSALLALLLSWLAAAGMTRLAERQIGGVTGDVAGACQQVCELAFLLGLLVEPWPR